MVTKLKRVLVLASNYGVWGEQLQVSWDKMKESGYQLTLATPKGLKPLPMKISVDSEYHDPVIKIRTNPPEICRRVMDLVESREWAEPIRFRDARMADYDAIVITGGRGVMLDMANNFNAHRLILDAMNSNKLIAAIGHGVTCLVYCRDPKNQFRSIIWGKHINARPAAWDFYGPDHDLTYELYGEAGKNRMTDVHTPGFLLPLEYVVRDAVGPRGECLANPQATRQAPEVTFDWPFITAPSFESTAAFAGRIVEVLNTR